MNNERPVGRETYTNTDPEASWSKDQRYTSAVVGSPEVFPPSSATGGVKADTQPPPALADASQGKALEEEILAFPVHSDLHDDSKNLVRLFAQAVAYKLHGAQIKYGYSNGWLTDDWEHKCRADLHRHIGKGDPLDVAIYAAFMWHRAWATSNTVPSTPAAPPVQLSGHSDFTPITVSASPTAPPESGLAPCPFCGAPATMRTMDTDEGDIFNVECSGFSCGARIEVLGIDQDTALAAWNRRAPSSAQGVTTVGDAE